MIDFTHQNLKDYFNAKDKATNNPEAFWDKVATNFDWHKPWDKVLEYDFHKPTVKWFLGGKLNITENCLDRHLKTQPNQTAIIFEPNDPSEIAEHITYKELHSRVCQAANMRKKKWCPKRR